MTIQKLKANLKQLKQFSKSLNAIIDKEVKIGVFADKGGNLTYEDGTTVLENAIWQEYGTSTIPARSFIRAPVEIRKQEIINFINTTYTQYLNNAISNDQGLELIGVFVYNKINMAFTNNGYGTWPALKSTTIKQKGSSKPLIDQGLLRRSITWVIV